MVGLGLGSLRATVVLVWIEGKGWELVFLGGRLVIAERGLAVKGLGAHLLLEQFGEVKRAEAFILFVLLMTGKQLLLDNSCCVFSLPFLVKLLLSLLSFSVFRVF